MNAETSTAIAAALHHSDADTLIADMGARARLAAKALAVATTAEKAKALRTAAAELRARAATILDANARDMEAGREGGLSSAMIDPLRLDEKRPPGARVPRGAVGTI